MTDLLIRDLDPLLERELKAMAQSSGQSLSKAAQVLMRRGMVPGQAKTGLGTEIRNLIPPEFRMDLEIPRDTKTRPPPDFS